MCELLEFDIAGSVALRRENISCVIRSVGSYPRSNASTYLFLSRPLSRCSASDRIGERPLTCQLPICSVPHRSSELVLAWSLDRAMPQMPSHCSPSLQRVSQTVSRLC